MRQHLDDGSDQHQEHEIEELAQLLAYDDSAFVSKWIHIDSGHICVRAERADTSGTAIDIVWATGHGEPQS